MQLDVNMMIIASLAAVIFILLAYIAWRFREEHVSMGGLQVDELLGRTRESERLLQIIKNQPCWACGGKEKDVSGNLFEDNEIVIACKKCGTEMTWKRGKQWTMKTETTNSIGKLEKIVEERKKSK